MQVTSVLSTMFFQFLGNYKIMIYPIIDFNILDINLESVVDINMYLHMKSQETIAYYSYIKILYRASIHTLT